MSIKNILIPVISFAVLAYLYPGFSFESTEGVAYSLLIFALFYLFVRPIFKILTIPLNFFTFGLAGLLVNALILFLTSYLVPGFNIIGFELFAFELNKLFSAAGAAIALSFISSILFFLAP